MINIITDDRIKVCNDGILIIECDTKQELKDIINNLLKGNNDVWEIELLNSILYTINNNLSTQEVA